MSAALLTFVCVNEPVDATLTAAEVVAACHRSGAGVVERRLGVLRDYRAISKVVDRPNEQHYRTAFAPYIMLLFLQRLTTTQSSGLSCAGVTVCASTRNRSRRGSATGGSGGWLRRPGEPDRNCAVVGQGPSGRAATHPAGRVGSCGHAAAD